MKIKNIAVRYIHLEAEPEDTQRRIDAAFDVLFEEIFAQKENSVDRRLPDNLIRTYGMGVVANG